MLDFGETFAAHIAKGSGVVAELDASGILDLVIQRGEDTPSGGDMFNEALRAFGSNVKAIRGTWIAGGTMSSNFDTFSSAVREGYGLEDAALRTFTGKMAFRNGYSKPIIVNLQMNKVVVEFQR